MLMGNLCVCLSGGMTRHVGVRKSLLDNCGKQPPPAPRNDDNCPGSGQGGSGTTGGDHAHADFLSPVPSAANHFHLRNIFITNIHFYYWNPPFPSNFWPVPLLELFQKNSPSRNSSFQEIHLRACYTFNTFRYSRCKMGPIWFYLCAKKKKKKYYNKALFFINAIFSQSLI